MSVVSSAATASSPSASPTNWVLIKRLFGLAWRYRLRCLHVLTLQLILLTMGLSGLSFTGLGIDYLRHEMSRREPVSGVPTVPFPHARLGLDLPEDWPPGSVIMLIAACI